MDLATKYLNLDLKSPLIISSCRLSESIDNIKQMEKAGAGAVVMYSIFEEEIRNDDNFNEYNFQLNADTFAEALTYFPNVDKQKSFLNQHLYHLKQAVKATSIPIIGSLNAISHQGWIDYAIEMQNTGIKALEINLYHLPTSQQSAEYLEKQSLDLIIELKQKINIPLVVKLSPFYTSLKDFICKLDQEAHVDGVVLFNRFYYPDINVKKLQLVTDIELSSSYEARLPMRWIALLQGQISCSIAGATGVETTEDLVKYILVGANAVTCASCLMRNDIDYLQVLLTGLEEWMREKSYNSISQIRGLLNLKSISNKTEFERAQYMHALRSFAQSSMYER
ncbi:MAG: dihydroorotate dehydrogenase-like protein [Gammaproteobacteria bacterium]|nr:dihydroorotate dehydrogenase-like protein [Gammaproteobacteria bacterium]